MALRNICGHIRTSVNLPGIGELQKECVQKMYYLIFFYENLLVCLWIWLLAHVVIENEKGHVINLIDQQTNLRPVA